MTSLPDDREHVHQKLRASYTDAGLWIHELRARAVEQLVCAHFGHDCGTLEKWVYGSILEATKFRLPHAEFDVSIKHAQEFLTDPATKRMAGRVIALGNPPAGPLVLGERHDNASGAWTRKLSLGGTEYVVGVEQGKPVRIAFKPRGQNRGFRWSGFVRDAAGKRVWEGEVGKSLGARGLLRYAGLLSGDAK